jgi:hypothetical protein
MKRIMLFIGLLVFALSLLAQTAIAPTNGDGSEGNPYQIATWQNLYWLSQTSSVWDKHFIQTGDIDFADASPAIETWDGGAGWSPIGNETFPFNGIYNGNSKIISELFINRPNDLYQGFFGKTNYYSNINNLGLTLINIIGQKYTGGIVGYNQGIISFCYTSGIVTGTEIFTGGITGISSNSISNCYNSGNITGVDSIGGITGRSISGTISNCYNTGLITGENYFGGITGGNMASISDCHNSGIINGTGDILGGITGKNSNNSTITNCYNIADISGNEIVGGISGNNSGIISFCYNTGNIVGIEDIGGISGINVLENSVISNSYSTGNITGNWFCGGLVGQNSSCVSNCYSTGNITGIENAIGGLTGRNYDGTISDCYSTGNVTRTEGVSTEFGGFIGYMFSGTISNCYSTGAVSFLSEIQTNKGFVGRVRSGTLSNCFWDIQTSQANTSGEYSGITGLPTADMKTQATYTNAGWSFPDVWNINPELNNGYPYLNYPNSVPNDDVTIETPLLTKAILHSAYPNPFNPSTTISFDLASPEIVSINIYNIKGQLIKNICNKTYDKGTHSIIWDGKDSKGKACGTGVYFYKMTASKTTQSKKMMMIK